MWPVLLREAVTVGNSSHAHLRDVCEDKNLFLTQMFFLHENAYNVRYFGLTFKNILKCPSCPNVLLKSLW